MTGLYKVIVGHKWRGLSPCKLREGNLMKNSNGQLTISMKSMMTLGAIVFLASFCGFLSSKIVTPSAVESAESSMPMVLKADSAARGKQMSMATGFVSEGVEGLFVLDHLSGRLQCWVINRRTGDIGGIYEASAAAALGGDKGGEMDYVMTTGQIDIQGVRGSDKPAHSVCYVGDGNSGKVVGYTFQFDNEAFAKGKVDRGRLGIICRGIIRNSAGTRDQE